MTSDAVETAAQLIHDTRHRMGTGGVCDGCREVARQVAEVLAVPILQSIERNAMAVAKPGNGFNAVERAIANWILTGGAS